MARMVDEMAWRSWWNSLRGSDSGGVVVATKRMNAEIWDWGRNDSVERCLVARSSATEKSIELSVGFPSS